MSTEAILIMSENTQEEKTKPNLEERQGFGAVRTRFELVTSCVTGRHSNQLN